MLKEANWDGGWLGLEDGTVLVFRGGAKNSRTKRYVRARPVLGDALVLRRYTYEWSHAVHKLPSLYS